MNPGVTITDFQIITMRLLVYFLVVFTTLAFFLEYSGKINQSAWRHTVPATMGQACLAQELVYIESPMSSFCGGKYFQNTHLQLLLFAHIYNAGREEVNCFVSQPSDIKYLSQE